MGNSPLPSEIEHEIKNYLVNYFQKRLIPLVDKAANLSNGFLDEEALYEEDPEGKKQPFLKAVFPSKAILVKRLERPFSTKLGKTFEGAAKIIAEHFHLKAKTNYKIRGMVDAFAITRIDQMMGLWRENSKNKLPFPEMVNQIVGIVDESKREISALADLYVKHSSGVNYFFEIKSPKPNKDQSLASMEKMLRLHLIHKGETTRTFYVMPFNPYGTRSAYKYTFAKTYLDFENFVLLQEEFWDNIIGPPGTFQLLVKLYQQAGKVVRDKIRTLLLE